MSPPDSTGLDDDQLPIDPDLAPDDPAEPSLKPRPRRRFAFERAKPDVLAAIALGGMVGASGRYGVSQVIHVPAGTFPWATFWTNVVGAFVLGISLVLLLERFPPTRYLRSFLATGVIGAFTTMSTFEVETVTLFKDGHAAIALAYGLGSVAGGLTAAVIGVRLGRLSGGLHQGATR